MTNKTKKAPVAVKESPIPGLGQTEYELTYAYVLVRLIAVFVAIPLISKLWYPFKYVQPTDSHIDYSMQQLDAFDAVHFKGVSGMDLTKGGYRFETNSAFFPLYPFIVNNTMQFLHIDEENMLVVGFLINMLIGWANTIMLYRTGEKFFGDDNMAQISAYLYVLSGSLVYHVSLYSENIFLFFALLGLLLIDGGDASRTWPETYRIVGSSMIFGMAASARSTGTLFSIQIAYNMLNKMVEKGSLWKIYKYSVFSVISAILLFLPLGVIVYWKPYELHCDTKLDVTNQVSPWCLESFKNVYNHIQFVYWDNQVLGFMYRDPKLFFIALTMNIIFCYTMYRVISGLSWINFFTLGLIRSQETKIRQKTSTDFFAKQEIIPHAFMYMVYMSIIFFFANIEINSRVAHTCPFFFWGSAAIIVENKPKWSGADIIGKLVVFQNLIYMCVNFVVYPMSVSFW